MSADFNYILVFAVVVFFVWRWNRFKKIKKMLPEYLKEGALIIDVRSPGEYALGHREGSFNIPLADLANKINTFNKDQLILLCCASGARSGVAATLLKSKGFNAVNAGPWTNLMN
jgi:rhodanese-related sulfurtransferase